MTVNTILGKLDRGEITTAEAAALLREERLARIGWLDRLLEWLVA